MNQNSRLNPDEEGSPVEVPAIMVAGGRPRNPDAMANTISHVSQAFRGIKKPMVAYIGTANGDSLVFFQMMKSMLKMAGAGKVVFVRLANEKPDLEAARNVLSKADVIFLFELTVKINYFSIFGTDSLQEVNSHLFSILQYIGYDNIEQWASYPMGILNVFELIYWLLLALFLSNYTKKSFGHSLGFVANTYGIGLLLWGIFVMYIVLFFS